MVRTRATKFYIKSIIQIPNDLSLEMAKNKIELLENKSNVKIKFEEYNPELNH